MANNVSVTQGSGTTFKTTDTAGVHTGHVNVDSSALPTGAATSAKQDTVIGHLDGVEGLLTTIDTDTGAIVGHVDGIETLLGTIDADTSALAAAVSGSEVQVDVVAALPAGNNNIGDVDIASIAAGDNNIGNVDVVTLPALAAGTNNIGDVDVLSVSGGVAANAADTATPVKVGARYDSTSPTYDNGDVTNLHADVRGSLHVALRQPGADAAISGGDLANDGLSTGTIGITSRAVGYMFNGSSVDRIRGDTTNGLYAGGAVAHDAADSGNPLKIGAKAIAALSGTTLVSAADRANAQADLDGALITRDNFALGDTVNGNASNTDGTSTQCIAAGASGVKHYLTDVTITNMSAVAIYVELKDGSTVKWTCPVPAGGGFTKSFKTPIAGSAATAWNFDPSAAATTVYCSMSAFKSKV